MIERQITLLEEKGIEFSKEKDDVMDKCRIITQKAIEIISGDVDMLETFYFGEIEDIECPKVREIRIQLRNFDKIIVDLRKQIKKIDNSILELRLMDLKARSKKVDTVKIDDPVSPEAIRLSKMLDSGEYVIISKEEYLQVKNNNAI